MMFLVLSAQGVGGHPLVAVLWTVSQLPPHGQRVEAVPTSHGSMPVDEGKTNALNDRKNGREQAAKGQGRQ